MPTELFLWFDPLAGIAAMLAARKWLVNFLFGLGLLILALFLGRAFCGWVCPLGTVLDISDLGLGFSKKKRVKNNPRVEKLPGSRFKSWKYILLVFFLVGAIFSLQLSWFLDPLPLLWRTVTQSLFPIAVFFGEGVFDLLFDLRILENFFLSFYEGLKAALLPLTQPVFQQGLFVLAIFIGIVALGKVSRRFWCRNLCPLAALYGLFSRFSLLQRKVSSACTDCTLCYPDCKMGAIHPDFRSTNKAECILCLNCREVCPVEAISYRFGPALGSPSSVDLGRRRLLKTGLAGVAAVGVVKTGYLKINPSEKAIRPPGAVEEEKFLDLCLRCGTCVQVCSTTGRCLQPSLLEAGWEGIWTPIADMRYGYCEFNCTLCGQVCPTQAIHPLTIEDKQRRKMGLALIDKSRCIPWYREEDCIVCEEHCPTPDKAIKFRIREVVKPDGRVVSVKFPYVAEELCIGCGICEMKCPVVGKAGIIITKAREERWMDE